MIYSKYIIFDLVNRNQIKWEPYSILSMSKVLLLDHNIRICEYSQISNVFDL